MPYLGLLLFIWQRQRISTLFSKIGHFHHGDCSNFCQVRTTFHVHSVKLLTKSNISSASRHTVWVLLLSQLTAAFLSHRMSYQLPGQNKNYILNHMLSRYHGAWTTTTALPLVAFFGLWSAHQAYISRIIFLDYSPSSQFGKPRRCCSRVMRAISFMNSHYIYFTHAVISDAVMRYYK